MRDPAAVNDAARLPWLCLIVPMLVAMNLSVVASVRAQSTATAPPRLAVFLDCHADCDFDLIRQEISYVDWVRERTAPDVHLLITSQGVGAGGSEYTPRVPRPAFDGRPRRHAALHHQPHDNG